MGRSLGKIYVFCLDWESPSGGIKHLYRHVDVLNRHGFSATIFHEKPGFRCGWFENQTPISYVGEVGLKPEDILVFPEVYGPNAATQILQKSPNIKKVIFNQNAYFTFGNYSFDPDERRNPYTHEDILGAIVVSEDSKRYLNYAFPNLKLFRLHLGIDSTLFAFQSDKKRQICFMPRKNSFDALQVINLLKFRDALKGFSVVSIEDKTEAEVAQTLQESAIFLSFGHPEGFGLPAAEAMACGCIAIGYHGGGGREFWNPEFSYPIEAGNILGFAKTVERVIAEYDRDPSQLQAKARRAGNYVLQHYTPEREAADIAEIWSNLLSEPTATPEPPQLKPSFRLSSEPITDYNPHLLQFIPADAKVILDIGCGNGSLGGRFKQIHPHCYYIGIEADLELAKVASTRLDRVFVGAIEAIAPSQLTLPEVSVDCLIFDRRLERLREPQDFLKRYKVLLKEGAQVLAFVANVQNWEILADLMRGTWKPGRTPTEELRFFTFESLKTLFAEAGFDVFSVPTVESKVEEWQQFQEAIAPVVEAMQLNPVQLGKETKAQAYVVRALNGRVPERKLFLQTLLISNMASDTVRVYQPDEKLKTIPGLRLFSKMHTADLSLSKPDEEKIFIWQRARLKKPHVFAQQKSLIDRGYLIVTEIDDDPRFWDDHIEHDFITYRSSHCLQTSTDTLAEHLRQFNPYVKIFYNQLPEIPLPRSYSSDGKVTIFFGALNREKDWAPLLASINRVLVQYAHKVRVQVIHDRGFFQAVQAEDKNFHPTCKYDRYHEILRQCDIALLPLNETEFNSMKSDLKFIECAGHGVAVLASPTVYERSLVDGETGFLYRSLAEFEEKFARLIDKDELRRQIANNAYHWVKDNRLLAYHYRQRYEWYLEMRDRLDELNAALRQRVPQIFGG